MRKAHQVRSSGLNEHHLAIISDLWGDRLVKGLRPKHVLELRDAFADTPRKAGHLVEMLSTIISWAIPREMAGDTNPCAEIPKFVSGEGWAPWEETDVDHARQHLARHLWWVAALALYTGQRQGDVLKMDWSAISDGAIAVRQSKTAKALWVPIHRDLAAILASVPRRSTRILTNSRGLPWSGGFKAAWQEAMNKPAFAYFRKRRLVFHGLRKAAVCMLLEAGCTDAEAAAITGQSRDMIEHYARLVNQRKLAKKAMTKWDGERRGNADCKTETLKIVKLGGGEASDGI